MGRGGAFGQGPASETQTWVLGLSSFDTPFLLWIENPLIWGYHAQAGFVILCVHSGKGEWLARGRARSDMRIAGPPGHRLQSAPGMHSEAGSVSIC